MTNPIVLCLGAIVWVLCFISVLRLIQVAAQDDEDGDK